MRYYTLLNENTAQQIVKKIQALTATINDGAATANEKENATNIKSRLEIKLQKEFPGTQVPAASIYRQQSAGDARATGNSSPWGPNMAADMAAYDQYQKDKADPNSDRSKYKRKIALLKSERKIQAQGSAMGNVEARERVKEIDRRVAKLYADFFPEEYAKILAARKKSSDTAYTRNREKIKQKADADTKSAATSGLSAAKAARMYPDVVTALIKALGTKYKYFRKSFALSALTSVKKSELKAALATLSPEQVTQIKEMVTAIHDHGAVTYDNQGYTPRQKEFVLSAFNTEFDQNAPPVDGGMTFADFKEKYEPIILKTKYKRNKWNKDPSLFDIFGKQADAYDTREYKEMISKKISDDERKEIIAGLKLVQSKDKVEHARVIRLLGLFGPHSTGKS